MGKLTHHVVQAGGAVIVTADHGNAEDMGERNPKTGQLLYDSTGRLVTKTSHSLNPVMCSIQMPEHFQKCFTLANIQNPGLGNIASTVATLLNLTLPENNFLPSLITHVC